jgi:hypothetical protein
MTDSVPNLMPIMTGGEHTKLIEYMKRAKFGLEFGMGGSTLMAARLNIPVYYSVESDPNWVTKCASHPTIDGMIKADRFELFHIDIGPTGDAGAPIDRSYIGQWHHYHSIIWSKLKHDPDFVFIDGRFRLACALQTAARCQIGTTVAIHDYVPRPFYHLAAQFLEPVEYVDTLQIFRISTTPDTKHLVSTLSEAFLDLR